MDPELRSYLEGMEARLNAHLDERLDARLDVKLAELEIRLEQRLEEKLEAKLEEKLEAKLEEKLESKFEEKLVPLELRLREHTETVETRLLTEFWKWARSTDIKNRQTSNDVSTLTERMNLVEERLRDLEFRRPL